MFIKTHTKKLEKKPSNFKHRFLMILNIVKNQNYIKELFMSHSLKVYDSFIECTQCAYTCDLLEMDVKQVKFLPFPRAETTALGFK